MTLSRNTRRADSEMSTAATSGCRSQPLSQPQLRENQFVLVAKMKFFSIDKIKQPDVTEGWVAASIGFKSSEIRILSYSSVGLFFLANALGFYIMGISYFDGFIAFVSDHSPILATLYVIFAFGLYYVLHELIHALTPPDHGLSNQSMLGMKSAAVFVVYNAMISKKCMRRVVLAPFVLLTPLCTLASVAAYLDLLPIAPIFVVNLLGLHLSACAGDLLLYRKLSRETGFSWMWNSVSSVWVK